MNTALKRIAAACAGALLLACATSPDRAARKPPPQADDTSAAARNRQATELAEKADYAGAIRLWRELTAAASIDPEAAYLFRNLGYALFLNGEYDAALASLEKACLLDPLNARGWQHLGSALRKLGRADRAALMFRQAAALERHEFTADYALAKGSSVPAIASAVAAPPRTAGEWATRELNASGGVVDLRYPEPPVTQAAAPAAAPSEPHETLAAAPDGTVTAPVDLPETSLANVAVGEPPLQPAVRLEVRNGNGVRGMAAETGRRLASDALRVVRLTNAKGFGVARTRVEYEAGFRDVASRLAAKFGAATMVEVDNCWKADLRLVIGKDLVTAGGKAAANAKTREQGDRANRPSAPARS